MDTTTRGSVGSQVVTPEMFEPVQFDSIPKGQVTDITTLNRKFQDIYNSIQNSLPPGPGREQSLYNLKQSQLWSQDTLIQSGRNVGSSGGGKH